MRRISGKKFVAGFFGVILLGMVGLTIFVRLVLWPLMTLPRPHPTTGPATAPVATQTAY